MERGRIPKKPDRVCKVQDVLDSIETAKKWFEPSRLQVASRMAKLTLEFLVSRSESIEIESDEEGRVSGLGINEKAWWPREEFTREPNNLMLELRNVRVRQIALSQGLAHFLKTMNDEGVIFEATVDDIDDATNLASLRAHERLMEEHLEGWHTSLNLETLKPLFLLKKGVNGNVHYHRMRCMELMGLWTSNSPVKKLGLGWRVKIGPLARIFHVEAYAPAIEQLRRDPRLQS